MRINKEMDGQVAKKVRREYGSKVVDSYISKLYKLKGKLKN